MNKDTDKTKDQLLVELAALRKNSKEQEDKLKASNQQLDAHNQQLQASEQQLRAANRQLTASEAKFKSYIQNAPDGVFIANEKGKYIEVNKAACEITGYSEVELLNLTIPELIQEEYTEKAKNHFQTLAKKGFTRGELGFVTKSNEKRFWSVDAVKLSNTRFLGFAKDITERKQAEKKLKESEERFRTVFNNANDIMYIIEVTKEKGPVVVDANNSAFELLGYTRDELIGMPMSELDGEESKEKIPERVKKIMSGGKFTFESLQLRKDGSLVPVEVSASLIKIAGKTYIYSVYRDITERKQAEIKLQESETRFRRLAETTSVAILIYQNDYWIYANPAAEKITGYSFDELQRMKFWTIVNPEYVNLVKERGKARQRGESAPSGYEFKIITKQGEEKWVFLTGNTLELSSGKAGMISAIDITDRKQAEQAGKKAEEALKESELKFQKIINESFVGISVVNEEGKIIVWNDALERITGINKTQTIDRYIWDVQVELLDRETSNAKRKEEVKTVLSDILKTGTAPWLNKTMEREYIHPDGTVKIVSDRMYTIKTHNGYLITSIDEDITKPRQAEKELTKLSTAVTQSPSIIEITDTEGKLEYVNPRFTEVTGYSREEAIGQNPRILKSGEHSDVFYKAFWETISSGKTLRGEIHNKKKNGELYWESASVSPIFDKQGNIVNYIKVAEDITERKQAEENFRHSIDESPLGIRIVNQAGKTIYVNKALLDIYEYSSLNEFLNTNAIDRYTGKSYQEHQERKKIRQEGGDVNDYEISIRRKNGEIRHIRVWRKEVIWNREKHFQVINQDITELKRLTTDLILAKEKAEESDRLKSAFLANMSHEIRTPMNGILGFTELLLDPDLTSEEKERYIHVVHKSGQRMLNTVNDIVEISKIEAGMIEVVQKETNVNESIEELVRFFKPEAEKKGLQLIIDEWLPESAKRVITDQNKLNSILTNLIKNAIKYTDSGKINLGCQKKEAEIEFYIEDTGIGVPADRIEAIFNRFEQADIADTRAFQGSGLGLAISKSYVEMLGGKIWVESVEGKGSTFYFTLPYNNEGAAKTNDPQPEPSEKNKTFRKLKILIAEDDETSELLIANYIRTFGKEILKARTGTEAVEACRNNPDIDLVLMDILMPDMGGYKATKQIREFNKEVVIIAQTAYALSGDREKAMDAGCNDYITKPFKKTELQNLIKKYFTK